MIEDGSEMARKKKEKHNISDGFTEASKENRVKKGQQRNQYF